MNLDPNYYTDDTEHNMWLDSDRRENLEYDDEDEYSYDENEDESDDEQSEEELDYAEVPPVVPITRQPSPKQGNKKWANYIFYCIIAVIAIFVVLIVFG